MAITPCDVRGCSLTGEFESLEDDQIQGVIDDIEVEINVEYIENTCPDLLDPLRKFMAAHEIVMRRRSGVGAAGPVSAEKAGDVSRAYKNSATVDTSQQEAYYMQTPYGQKVLRYFRLIPVSPIAVSTKGSDVYCG